MLEFDAERHEYRHGGRLIPSVTQVLKPLTNFDFISPAALEHARQEGTAMHKMVELDVKGTLDTDGLPPWLAPRLAAWQRFRTETGFVPVICEEPFAHPSMGYAGTPDLAGTARGETWLIDVKRSLYAGRAIGLQTAAYARLVEANGVTQKVRRRFALILRDDGTFRLTEYKEPSDDAVFLASLTMHKWLSQGVPA